MDVNAESTSQGCLSQQHKITNGPDAEAVLKSVPVMPRANFKFEFPTPELPEMLVDLSHLQDLVNLEQVIVIWLR